MDVFRTDRIRNVVLLGHGGAGKTTLTEAMAYLSGITNLLFITFWLLSFVLTIKLVP